LAAARGWVGCLGAVVCWGVQVSLGWAGQAGARHLVGSGSRAGRAGGVGRGHGPGQGTTSAGRRANRLLVGARGLALPAAGLKMGRKGHTQDP
jgi:hypothetical protein